MKPFYTYLLRCSDATYYAGQTDDLDARMHQHAIGKVGYTATRKPVELVWRGEFETRESAIAFEQQIKGWSRAKKEALIRGDWDEVKELAKSKSRYTVNNSPSTSSGRTVSVAQIMGAHGESIQRRTIAKAITLLESTRADHRAQADELLTELLPHAGQSLRLGISGVPGVGKSTFIEALGLHLIAQGHRVAVLAVDPSSSVSGGSILGDKTRMEFLSVHPQAFIRPSPASGTLGGVASMTREAMLVCEAAGYDVVIVETVGVGQSEIAVAGMTDMYVLMQLPNAGDELQAVKRGVMELADLVLINKADLDAAAATQAQAYIASALRIFSQQGNPAHMAHDEAIWQPKVLQLSALQGTGVDAFWAAAAQFKTLQTANGKLALRRQNQALAWMWERIDAGLKRAFRTHPQVEALLVQTTREVAQGRLPASTAARNLLQAQAGQSDNAI